MVRSAVALSFVCALAACSGNDDSSGGGAAAGNGSAGSTGNCAEPAELAGITAAHNRIRADVQAASGGALPPLTWSCGVASYAQNYADDLATQGCPLDHSSGPYGENLYWSSGNASPEDAVEAWASEGQCYTYGRFPEQCSGACGDCGHYTQIVWRDSTSLGCGKANCSDASVWVCDYDPPGNFVGEYPY